MSLLIYFCIYLYNICLHENIFICQVNYTALWSRESVPLRFHCCPFPFLISIRRRIIRVVRTARTSASARSSTSHIQAVVEHVSDAIHIQILVRGGDLSQRRADNAEIASEFADHRCDLLGIRQDFNTHRVRVVAHSKWPLDALGKSSLSKD